MNGCLLTVGIVEAAYGLMSPALRLSPGHQRSQVDYEWAFGFHPFAPFGSAPLLPQMLADSGTLRRCNAHSEL